MTKEFQVYYDSEDWNWRCGRIFPYYLGFENLLSSQLTNFSNAINSQCQYNDSFSLSEYLDVSQETFPRKLSFGNLDSIWIYSIMQDQYIRAWLLPIVICSGMRIILLRI